MSAAPVNVAPANAAPLRLGVVGLGRAFTLMLPTFVHDGRVRLVAATDTQAAPRAQFESDFGARTHDTVEALCADPQVEAVYIASPHQFHADHVCAAAAAGKHVLVEKPMALTLAECSRMVDACRAAGVQLVVGHSHSFNTPVARARAMIDAGTYGRVRMITALNFTDFLYRPRRPEELDTRAGGGVIHSQAAHQVDIVRLLGGGLVDSVRAHTGVWDSSRPTEGAYSVLLGFEGGAFATAVYSGYGHFDSDLLTGSLGNDDGTADGSIGRIGNIGEMGQVKHAADQGAARRRLAAVGDPAQEAALKAARNYGGSAYQAEIWRAGERAHQHFGPLIVSCDRADIVPGPTGIAIHGDDGVRFEPLPPPPVPRQEVIDELLAAVRGGKPPVHSGEWARATTSVCLALLQSAREGRDVRPTHQVRYWSA